MAEADRKHLADSITVLKESVKEVHRFYPVMLAPREKEADDGEDPLKAIRQGRDHRIDVAYDGVVEEKFLSKYDIPPMQMVGMEVARTDHTAVVVVAGC